MLTRWLVALCRQVAGDTRNFIPPGSYLEEFVLAADQELNEVGDAVYVYMDLQGVNIYDQGLLERMQKLAADVRDNDWVSDCSISALPDMLLSMYATSPDADTFYEALKVRL